MLLKKIKTFIKKIFSRFFKKNLKFTLYVGLNDKDTKKQEYATEKAKDIITDIFAKNNITGATFIQSQGLYQYITGEKEKENTFKIELLFVNKKQVKNAVDKIKQVLNQESIAVAIDKVNSELL